MQLPLDECMQNTTWKQSSCNNSALTVQTGQHLWRPKFSPGVVNSNGQVNSVDFGQTTVNLGHRHENITNDP
jgi:hypothetical protein